MFACDFFKVDIFGFNYNITTNPNIRFVRSQISHFEELYPESCLIHDNSGELRYFPYDDYDIKGVAITPYSPNMNAFAERFIRSVRQECLDWFIIFSEKQLRNIIENYMKYYNKYRPHQGINSIPEQSLLKRMANLKRNHNYYYRKVS